MTNATFFPYALELLIVSGAGTVFYLLMLRRENRFVWNRMFLLALSALAVLMPLITWRGSVPWSDGTLSEAILEPVLITAEEVGDAAFKISWAMVSAAISLILLLRGGIRLINLWRFRQQCGDARMVLDTACYFTGGKLGTSSFGPWLFWDETLELTDVEKRQILDHEGCHIRQRHSLDLLWMEVLLILFWWNPAFYLLRSLMIANHEALADQAAIGSSDANLYRQLLLKQWLRPRMALTHEFIFSHTKHRIDMLFSSSTKAGSAWKYAMILPTLALLFFFIGCQNPTFAQDSLPTILEFTEVDVAPVPINLAEVKGEIGYPTEAKEQKIEGLVVARILIGKDGSYLDHKFVKSDNELLEQAVAVHVKDLKFEPATKDGVPVSMWVNIPFNFKLP
ncbi:MAG: M56 family metallopeptidase [Bacteroidia bacterium]|nr:M56 family metallopeptidase [Bacteroidia bacterium]